MIRAVLLSMFLSSCAALRPAGKVTVTYEPEKLNQTIQSGFSGVTKRLDRMEGRTAMNSERLGRMERRQMHLLQYQREAERDHAAHKEKLTILQGHMANQIRETFQNQTRLDRHAARLRFLEKKLEVSI